MASGGEDGQPTRVLVGVMVAVEVFVAEGVGASLVESSTAPPLAASSCVGVNGVSVPAADSVPSTALTRASIVSVSHAVNVSNNASANPRDTNFFIDDLHSLKIGIVKV
jgi:hypothetical protein